ncbi:hypothetical protein EUTSA_v10012065mg, partial [Eutrema salsugineum]
EYWNECRVLTWGSAQESWRTVKTNHRHFTCPTSGRCIKGFLYYLAGNYETCDLVLMRIDVRSETFEMIRLPSDIRFDIRINYQGRLACADKKNGRRLWILEDGEKHKWASQDFLSPFGHLNKSLKTHFKLFIFVPPIFRKSLYIFFWDPVRNSFRRFEFKGIADDDEPFLNNGVQIRREYVLYTFPNQI